uniref:O-methyltransferase n=1 Tax=Panagrolaimus sp. ES5 TaxID=591445 RepID=A0AC34G6B6_9BILA
MEKELYEETFKRARMAMMIGAPEVLQFGKNFIRLIQAKRCLDVGTFTGASALAWALALPLDGEVATFDVDHTNLNNIGKPIIEKWDPELLNKIKFHLGPATDSLESLIKNGESGKWDFAFIDADKENYPKYYQQCMKLLRSGGVILIDNALRGGRVAENPSTFNEAEKAIDATNQQIFEDENADNILLNVGD